MWIFAKSGFFSVVAHRGAPDCVLVRSRWRWPLEGLLAECPPAGGGILAGAGIIEIPGDYRFRVAVRRVDFGLWLSAQAEGIDYDNFKSAAHHVPGWGPAMGALHRIWSVLAEAAERPARPAFQHKPRPTSAPALTGPRRRPTQPTLPL
jgi:hypothetical protein